MFVMPFAVFLMIGGLVLATLFWFIRVTITSPFPFIESETANRHLLGILSLICFWIGFGLWFRNRVAWYALLAYLPLGVLLPAIAIADSRLVARQGYWFPILGSLLNGLISIGLYLALRPAFVDESGRRGRRRNVNPSGDAIGL